MKALQITPASRIVTIASGGCNVMSYLTAGPAKIYAVDLNETHVALNKLKLAAVRTLPNYATFHRFFAHASDRRNVRLYDDLIAPTLDGDSRAYWEGRDITAAHHTLCAQLLPVRPARSFHHIRTRKCAGAGN
jgi:S-adenosylmethionine-diacylglycerol 3-amino-3-carboxypropyl transferase